MSARTVQVPTGDVAGRLRAASSAMQTSERRVMEVVVNQPQLVVDSSVTEVARLAGTAVSTVVRMCKRAGFRGFHELKLKLVSDLAARQDGPLVHSDGLTSDTPPSDLLNRVLWLSVQAIESAGVTVDPSAFDQAVTRLSGAGRVLVIGNGTSMAPAQDAAYRFLMVGLDAVAPSDSYTQDTIARQLLPGDVCLGISHTGATKDTVRALGSAKAAGAFVILISSFNESPTSEAADVLLVAGGHEQGFRLEAMASRLSHLAVVDALFVGVALHEQERAVKNLGVMARVTADRSL